jgi:hypothetical protein
MSLQLIIEIKSISNNYPASVHIYKYSDGWLFTISCPIIYDIFIVEIFLVFLNTPISPELII